MQSRFLLIVAVLAAALNAQTTGLSFRPTAAAYSSALDRIIFASASPNLLHIYDPVGQTDQTVALTEAPAGVSLTPDGLNAAVTLVDAVSYVNLQTQAVQTFSNILISGSAIAATGYIYVPAQYSSQTVINLSNGQVTAGGLSLPGTNGVYNSVLSAIYTTSNDLYRNNVSGTTIGPYTSLGLSRSYTFQTCGSLWLSVDNSKLYTGCGTVFSTSADATKDGRYLGILSSLPYIQSLSTSNSLNQVAAIAQTPTYVLAGTTPPNDTQILLFDSTFYNQTGQFQTNPFSTRSATYPAHGKWIFYNSSSSKIFVVTQADSTAGLSLDYAIDTISLQNVNSCNAQFASSSAGAIAAGSYATTQILSGEDCVFTAVSNVPWITLTSGYYGSGNTALTYLVRPNLTPSARSGTITLGSQTLSVTQDAAAAAASFQPLSINPVAADYDKALDKIIMVSSSPNELHIYDPVSQQDQIVALSGVPLSVSVSPNGVFAAVGHHGFISYVDLTALTVNKLIPVDMDAGGMLLAGNGYAYAFPSGQSFTNWYSVKISDGTLSALFDTYNGNVPRLDSTGIYMYVGNGIGVSKYNISNGPAMLVTDNSFAGDGAIWLSEDGTRLFDSYGQVYFISTIAAQDLQPSGSFLVAPYTLAWVNESQVNHQTAVLTSSSKLGDGTVGNAQLQIYSDNGLQLQGQQSLPSFTSGGSQFPSQGQYLFWNAAETSLYAITQASSSAGLLSSFAVNTISAPASIPACSYSVSPNTLYVNSGGTWTVTVSSSCSWSPIISDTSWLSNASGNSSTTFGNGTFSLYVSPNTGAQRSQTIKVGTQSVTVIQPAATCTYSLSPTQLNPTYNGGTGTVQLTTQSSCPWSSQSSSSWLMVGPQSGTGSAAISYTAAPNTVNSARDGSLNIGGRIIYVDQDPFPSSVALNFVPVTPCRVADTRNATGQFGGPAIARSNTRSFTIPSSACNIPSSAAAYSFNVAVVPHGSLGYLTAWATGQPQPYASTINSPDGRIKSTAAIVPAGTGSAVNFYTTSTTDLVLDINGYFIPASANAGLNYYPLNPCRVADTRNSTGPLGGPFLTAGQERDVPVQQSACSVSPDAQAYSVNIAAVPLSGQLGYLSLWPTGQSQPLVASLNAPTGTVTSNAALLPAGIGGDIALFASNDTQAIIDINGYFAPASASGLHLYTVQPCRILDTRLGQNVQYLTGTMAVQVGGNCNIPSNAQAVVVNATVVPPGPLGYLTLWAEGEPQPTVATLNASDASITSNMAIVPMLDGVINAYASNPTHLVIDVAGYFAP